MATTEQNTPQTQRAFPEYIPPNNTIASTTPAEDVLQLQEEDDNPIIIPRERERGRTRRIPLRRRRDFSAASSTYSPSPTRSPALEVVSSHTELFAPSRTTSTPTPDRLVLLGPFTRPAYITTHAASRYDFTHWLPLLALGAPETWYAFSNNDSVISTSLKQPLLAAPNTYLRPLGDPRPVGLRIPRISANDPLHPHHSSLSAPKLKTEAEASPAAGQQDLDLIYLSIQSSITGHTTHRSGRWVSPERGMMPDLAGSGTTGSSIYRVVRCGSREEAATQAFYAAGGNRWSTLFTCVVVDDGHRALSGRVLVLDGEGYERVRSLGELVEGEGKRGKIRVFY
ncbi:hypothetical protein BJY01DRAFT_135806 [Aspergillus pseudoustus]|uniref:Uncharacterized protein n=1 Tax=Aspergillus pseudoustus TaxID=1810923 RepID=A0ABR4IIV3_9EURO